jgi:hypothetical protein
MSNAARDLHELLASWASVPKGQDIYAVRGGGNPGSDAFWQEQVRAAQLLGDVSLALQRLASEREVGHWMRSFPAWSQALFVPLRGWDARTQTGWRAIDQAHLDNLAGFAAFMDGQALYVSSDGRKHAHDGLVEIEEILKDASLTEAERRYAWRLLEEVRSLLSEANSFGTIRLVERINELFGFLNLLAEAFETRRNDKPRADKLRSAAREIVPWLALGLGMIQSGMDIATATLELTSGPEIVIEVTTEEVGE